MKALKFALVSPLFAAACVSGGNDAANLPNGSVYSLKVAEGQKMASESLAQTSTLNMPRAGTASYSGVAGFSTTSINPVEVMGAPEMVSDLNLNVDLFRNTVSGNFSNFEAADSGSIIGNIDITNGTISGSDFYGTASGQISRNSVTSEVNGNILGDFKGSEAAIASGELFGSLSNSSQTVPWYSIFYLKKR